MAIPEKMTAIEIAFAGGPDALQPTSVPVPSPDEHEVLIKVVAAGVNRPDIMQRKGLYPPPPDASPLPGLEVSGTIAALGSSTSRFEVGDEVCALVPGGGYAEYAVVCESICLPVPKALSVEHAAGLPETFFTVWTNVFERGALQAGEVLLVHGGAGGIGTSAIMIASNMGARVFATAGSAEKCRVCEELGAERAIDYTREDFVAVLKEATGNKGADVILDMVGGEYIARNMKAAAHGGRIVNIAFMKGSRVEVNFMPLLIKHLTMSGSTLRPRSVADKASIARALEENVWPLIESGKIKPVIYAEFPLTQASKAHELMESSNHIGKILLNTLPV